MEWCGGMPNPNVQDFIPACKKVPVLLGGRNKINYSKKLAIAKQ